MKKLLPILLAFALTGCATNHAIVPSLEGKPRVKINKPVPKLPAPAPSTNETKGE
jgi:hypothetical protein